MFGGGSTHPLMSSSWFTPIVLGETETKACARISAAEVDGIEEMTIDANKATNSEYTNCFFIVFIFLSPNFSVVDFCSVFNINLAREAPTLSIPSNELQ